MVTDMGGGQIGGLPSGVLGSSGVFLNVWESS
jgi:hypothetical protein